MLLSVIIVNYNVKYFLEQCLHSVQKACSNIEAEIIVADNNSNDGSKDFLPALFPNVNFIWNATNIGFAKANNQALAAAKGKFILYLNPDTILPEDVIDKCLNFFEQHTNAGGLGIKMIDGSGKFLKESKRAFPSPLTSFFKLSGMAMLFSKSKFFARYHLGHLPENETHEVDVLAGAFMMMPKKILDEVGDFDEQFFMYGEDVDLSYRIQKAGYKNYYFADSTIIHFKGESTKRGSLNYVRMFYKAMSLFVKKHYSGTKAGIYIFFIQAAILMRALFSAIGHLLKKIGLPVLDAIIILTSLWLTKFFWSNYIKGETNYSPNVILIAFPVFTAIFLLAAYYTGLYDKGYKQSQLVRSTLVAALIILSTYALLPESVRFSRGILVLGIALSYILMNIMRRLFIKWQYLETIPKDYERQQTIVVAGEKDYKAITSLMQQAGMPEKVLGRIESGLTQTGLSLGKINQLPSLVKKYSVNEIIFCENGLSFKEIINIVKTLPTGIYSKFHSAGSSSIVGSNSSKEKGDYVAVGNNYNIANPVQRRNKRLLDILLSMFFIIGFPVFIFLQKKITKFYKNVFDVLFAKKTWVGYAAMPNSFPALKTPVLTSTSLPSQLNELPVEALLKSDEWYATGYSVLTDLKKINRGFKFLCY
ncbi:MAG: glycosyltransferase [Ferruginibacter sp.]|nr:glycosyltransferase [Bacteroidota bacterium]MBX2918184.1 glycosyltransferase [Ferruginibacter sp.]